MRRALNILLIFLIRLYRWILSPLKNVLFGPLGRCRFDPSCSAYALEALQTHGPFRGSWLALKRIGRCNPWGGCGHDPVPPRSHTQACAHPKHAQPTRTPLAVVSH
jgi:putative membrane protein insertion efficiency factor